MKEENARKELKISQAVCSLKAGDYSNFNIIYEENYDAIYAFLNQKLFKNHPVAEDLTSETFIKFLLSVDRYTHVNRFKLRSFLYSIAFRIFVDHYRKVKNISFIEIDEDTLNLLQTDGTTITHSIDKKIYRSLIFNALQRIDPKYRKVIELFYLNEMSYKEIQSELNIPETTIKIHLNRARHLLRCQLRKTKIFSDRLQPKLSLN